MPRDKSHIAQRPKFFHDGLNKLSRIASRKIRAADGASEQYIPDESQIVLLAKENHMPGRMPGAMNNIPFGFAHFHLVAVAQPAIRRKGIHAVDLVLRGVRGNALDPKGIFLRGSLNRRARGGLQGLRAAAMIQMAVRQPDFFNLDALFLDFLFNERNIAARIHNGAFLCLIAYDKCAILLKRRDGNDIAGDSWAFQDHGQPFFKKVLPRLISPLQYGICRVYP